MKKNRSSTCFLFGAVQSLERYIEKIEVKMTKDSNLPCDIAECKKIVKEMRKIGNKVQLLLAGNKKAEIAKQLEVFYGLDTMIRAEVIKAFLQLYKNTNYKSHVAIEQRISH